jgi:hypothetical protein
MAKNAKVVSLDERRSKKVRVSKIPAWFGGVAEWNREPDPKDLERGIYQAFDPMNGVTRRQPFSESERRKLDMWRAEREKKIQKLISKVRDCVHEISRIDAGKHGVSYDPLVAYVAIMNTVHYVLFSEDLPPAARTEVLHIARECLGNMKTAAAAIAAHANESK